jgi:hypothetical protein
MLFTYIHAHVSSHIFFLIIMPVLTLHTCSLRRAHIGKPSTSMENPTNRAPHTPIGQTTDGQIDHQGYACDRLLTTTPQNQQRPYGLENGAFFAPQSHIQHNGYQIHGQKPQLHDREYTTGTMQSTTESSSHQAPQHSDNFSPLQPHQDFQDNISYAFHAEKHANQLAEMHQRNHAANGHHQQYEDHQTQQEHQRHSMRQPHKQQQSHLPQPALQGKSVQPSSHHSGNHAEIDPQRHSMQMSDHQHANHSELQLQRHSMQHPYDQQENHNRLETPGKSILQSPFQHQGSHTEHESPRPITQQQSHQQHNAYDVRDDPSAKRRFQEEHSFDNFPENAHVDSSRYIQREDSRSHQSHNVPQLHIPYVTPALPRGQSEHHQQAGPQGREPLASAYNPYQNEKCDTRGHDGNVQIRFPQQLDQRHYPPGADTRNRTNTVMHAGSIPSQHGHKAHGHHLPSPHNQNRTSTAIHMENMQAQHGHEAQQQCQQSLHTQNSPHTHIRASTVMHAENMPVQDGHEAQRQYSIPNQATNNSSHNSMHVTSQKQPAAAVHYSRTSSPAFREPIPAPIFIHTPNVPTFQPSQNDCMFSLPEECIALFASRGIQKPFDWQKECLSLPCISRGANLVYSLPTVSICLMCIECMCVCIYTCIYIYIYICSMHVIYIYIYIYIYILFIKFAHTQLC